MPQVAQTDKEIQDCFDVMSLLRPHLVRADFLSSVRQMESEGYRLDFLEHGGKVVAVAGYRVVTNFHMGRHLYVEDLVTAAEARSMGFGDKMISWLRDEARSKDCSFLDLISGVQRARAHKFYFERGFSIANFHFGQKLDES